MQEYTQQKSIHIPTNTDRNVMCSGFRSPMQGFFLSGDNFSSGATLMQQAIMEIFH